MHSCIQSSNENNNTNENHYHLRAKPSGTSGAIYQLSQRRNEKIIGNNCHLDSQSVDVGLADSEGNSNLKILAIIVISHSSILI